MKKPLPDYYAILEVQPDASQEFIKASYRRLMATLKRHPDLGGDHEIAARINEAYAVLGDKVKRTAYARAFLLQRITTAQSAAGGKERRSGKGTSPLPATVAATRSKSAPSADDECCPLCRTALPQSIGPETRCEGCRSPLSPPPQPGAYGHELFGRRRSARSAKTQVGTVTLAGQAQGFSVRMRDLSLNGISFYSERAIAAEQVLNFRGPTLEALAVVVSCRKRGRSYSVHARLLTVVFHDKVGVFVSSSG